MKGYLLLEDGSVFEGRSFGASGIDGGEIVFNTAMTGYQEILTDPSYAGQIILMTYPLIGNYGANSEDIESAKIFAKGFVVREFTGHYSNWRASMSLSEYLADAGIVALEGIDTRAVTRRIREQGALRAVMGTEPHTLPELKAKLSDIPMMAGRSLAKDVACKENYTWDSDTKGEKLEKADSHILVVDCGVKRNILRRLVDEGARVTVAPPSISVEEIKRLSPDGLMISNGPGDPEAVEDLPETLAQFIGKIPMMGICLGHQLLARSLGAKTFKLKFGHHGANHPVRNERTGRIEITSQNHGFSVDAESLKKIGESRFGPVNITHIHLSDDTVEGFEVPQAGVRAIQYHPEASPGPHDASYLFKEFLECTKRT